MRDDEVGIGDLDQPERLHHAHTEASLRLLSRGVPRAHEGGAVNRRYRKQMRLRSQHYRRGHTPFCKCWEPWQMLGIRLKRRIDSGVPLPVRKVRLRPSSTSRDPGAPG